MRASTTMVALALAGCVTSYVPMAGLQRPVAIDRRFLNFAGTKVVVTCLPDDALDRDEARDLCRKVGRMFENQGATVVQAATPFDEAEPGAARVKGGLNVFISGRLVHEETSNLFGWTRVVDYTVAQDVTVRDEDGFLLVRETLTARFVTELGFTSDAEARFSKDFYGQLSQIALNAKVRRAVLREGDAKAAL